MGQAQRSRQRSVPYREVELELWELDGEDNQKGRGGRNRPAGRNVQNIRAYEQRQSRNAQNYPGSRTGNRANSRGANRTNRQTAVRELQVQDIRRYQNGRAEGRSGAAAGYAYEGSARPVQSIKRRKARRRKIFLARMTALALVMLCLVLIYILTGEIYQFVHSRRTHDDTGQGLLRTVAEQDESIGIAPPEIIEDYLEVNDFSRPGTRLDRVNSIFVHYTANPGTSAAQNRSYFANLPLTRERSASAHLIIGYEGEIVQCIPLDEQAYAVMTRNEDSISIECCYTAEDGSFTPETYDTLVHTLAWLLDKYDLSTDDILRHYDCGGKLCPVYYVEHEDAWQQLLQDVSAYIDAEDV